MNEFIKQFLELFDLEAMGWQPFILLQYYPGNRLEHSTRIYMTLGRLHGPVNVTFQADNVNFLSVFRPVEVNYCKESGSSFGEKIEVTTDSKSVSFHMIDLIQCPLHEIGYVMTRTSRACRLITGREEIQSFLKLLYTHTKKEVEWGHRWDSLRKMFEAALPKTHMFRHDFEYKRPESVS